MMVVRPSAEATRPSLRLGGGMRAALLVMAGFAILLVAAQSLLLPGEAAHIDHYLPFHIAVEVLAVAIAAMIFSVGWHAAEERGSSFLMLLSTAFLGVALLDLAHLLSFAGMPVFVTASGTEKAINFWLAARITAAGALLLAVLIPGLSVPRRARVAALGVALAWSAAAYWVVLFHSEWLPSTFIPGQGLTRFKIGAEYFIVALHAATAAVIWWRLPRVREYAAFSLFLALGLMALSELSFTLYTRVSDWFNLLGHIYKIAAYGFLYHSVFVVAVRQPYRELAVSEQAARESEAHFRMMFDAAPDAVFLLDEGGRIVLANATSQRLLGYAHDELVGQPVEMLLPKPMRARHVAHRERYVAHPVPRPMGARLDILAQCRDGTIMPVAVSLSPVDVEGRQETIAVVRDITAAREMENLLRRHSQEFQALVDNAPDVIARFDRDLRFLYANPAIEAAIGREHLECLGKTWSELGLPPDAAEAWQHGVREVFERGEAVTIECGMEMPEMGTRYFHVRMAPERDMEDRIASVLVIARDISERRRYEDQLCHQATHDALTGLPNRTLILDRIQQAIPHAHRSHGLLAVAYLDLDHFKDINDTLGHVAGDDLLRQAAARVAGALRPGDTVARHSGDEFILLLPDIAQQQDVSLVAEKIIDALARPFPVGGREVYVTGSLGLAVYPVDSGDAETLLRNADVAMYRAKEEGRNAFRFYVSEMDARMRARIETEHDLRRAIERGELVLHYQPRVSLTSGAVLGFEALVRWNHPAEGLVGPDRFIGVAEDTGLIVPLGDWVLEAACRRAQQWQDMGFPKLGVAVNLSARQFRDPELLGRVERVLAETRLDPCCLELEITESTVMHDTQKAIETLRALKKLGITLSVDDFGTGYSSLSYLKLFPIDVLKIDRSFVLDVTTDPDDAAIVRAIVTLAHSLGLMVVAEGAEEAAQVAFLRYVDCDELQGYYFSRPLPEDDAERLLRSGRRLDVGMLASDRLERTLLIVDDEVAARNALARTLAGEEYRILCAGSASEALSTLAIHGAQVVLCAQSMPGMTGIEFLSRIKQVFPETMRIIYSGQTNGDILAEAVNHGAAFKALGKPWDHDELSGTIRDAFNAYALGAQMQGQLDLARGWRSQ